MSSVQTEKQNKIQHTKIIPGASQPAKKRSDYGLGWILVLQSGWRGQAGQGTSKAHSKQYKKADTETRST